MCEPDRIPDPPWFLRPRPVGARPYPDDMSTARLPATIPNLEIRRPDGSGLVMGRPGSDTPDAIAALAVSDDDADGTTVIIGLNRAELVRVVAWSVDHLAAVDDLTP
jgi:hypothetical protein